MKAIQIAQTGGPEVLTYVDVPDPRPGPGQALVELKAIGVNYMDVYGRSGIAFQTLPWIPGGEGAGIVAEIGEGVTEVAVGDLVAYSAAPSSYAERVVVPSWRLVKLPEGLDTEAGASALLQGMTAHYLCHDTYPVKPGEIVLVHAAAGGVGTLLTQMVKAAGARVIATVSTKAKAQVAKEAGADHVILYREQDFEEEVNRITDGAGVPVVYDGVGATTFEKSLACLARRGYLVLYGHSSGPPQPIPPTILTARSRYLTRPSLGDYAATRADLLRRAGDVLGWVQSGKLRLRIHARFPLQDAAEAHRQLQERQTTGKVLLIP